MPAGLFNENSAHGINTLPSDGRVLPGQLTQLARVSRVLLITPDADAQRSLQVLRAGVTGVLSKLAAVYYLGEALRVVAAGGNWVDPTITKRMVDDLAIASPLTLGFHQLVSALSHRERQVLEYIGRGLTNKQIACELFLSEHTVKAHVRSILHKLDLTNRTVRRSLAKYAPNLCG